jgi:fructose-specific phosphotransferase system IIC component
METPSEEFVPIETNGNQRAILIGALLLLLVLIAGVVLAVISMVNHPDQTETIRDIVIIFMALESLIIGLTLIVLIIQLAKLTALLQNEIRPILESTNETVDTLRGTTTFLSNNLVQPVIKANSTFAAVRQALGLIGLRRSNSQDSQTAQDPAEEYTD